MQDSGFRMQDSGSRMQDKCLYVRPDALSTENNAKCASPASCLLHPASKKIRIIGLGNSILTDDGVGIYAAREVSRRLAAAGLGEDVDIVESEVAGFALMELMAGWDRIILIDSIQFDGLESGLVIRIEPEDLHTSLRLRSVHDIDLPTTLELGRRLGFAMPGEITIFGIQAEDPLTFGESLTGAAERGLGEAVELVLREIRN
jgi:hydrogenase maturation protease